MNITWADKVDNTLGTTGVVNAADMNQIKASVNSKSDLRSDFTALSGSTWDGTPKSLVLSSNTALTLSTALKQGSLIVKQDATGGRTLSINGTSSDINTGANTYSIVSFIYNEALSVFVIAIDKNTLGAVVTDTIAPTVVSRTTLNATTIRVVMSEAVTSSVTGHSFRKNGSALTPTAVSGSGTTTLDFTVPTMASGDTIDHSYDSSTGNTLDSASNELVSFTNQTVSNTISGGGDVTAPTISSATVANANSIRIVANEPTTFTLPGWSFKKNGSALTPSSVNTINSTTADFVVPTIVAGDTILRSYNSGTGDTKDTANNELVSFTDQAVTNGLTGDTTAPTVVSRTVTDTNHIRIVFSEAVTDTVEGISSTMGGFSFTKNGSAFVPTTYLGTGTNTFDFTMPGTMAPGDVITSTYSAGIGNAQDAAANLLASFSAQAVTNGLTAITLATAGWIQRTDPRLTSKLKLRTSGGTDFVEAMLDIQHGGTLTPEVLEPHFDFQNPTTTEQPIYSATGLGGNACLTIASGKSLANTAQWVTAVGMPLTRFCVVEFISLVDGGYFMYSINGDPCNALYYSGKFSMYAGSLLDFTGITPAINTKYLFWLEFNGATSKGRVNGVEYASGNAGTPSFGYAGSRYGGVAQANFKLADSGIYAGLFSSGDRAILEAELMTKHGI